MEMSLQRVRSIGGWDPSDMIMLGQRFSFSTGMELVFMVLEKTIKVGL